MSGLFTGINIALQAMLSNQKAIQVVEHNVANANTPGYKRQEAVMAAGVPYSMPSLRGMVIPGQMGTGVIVDRIKQFNLEFFDGRYRNELAETSRWNIQRDMLNQIELTLAETTSDGLSSRLDAFWSAWQALSNDPSNMAIRADLKERANSLINGLNWRAEALVKIRKDQDLTIIERVSEINSLASQVARLNTEIVHIKGTGNQPNDLIDERDRHLNRLSEIGGAVANIQDNGEALVSIGGHSLVIGSSVYTLSTEPDSTNSNLTRIYWKEDNLSFSAKKGELAGLMEVRDTVIPQFQTVLDNLANQLVTQVNQTHYNGFGLSAGSFENYFFDPTRTTAMSITLSSDIDDLGNIAAAGTINSPGDGSNALTINVLQNALVLEGNTATINQYYTRQTSELGLLIRQATTRAEDRRIVSESLEMMRESVAGVNLDEEAANLVKYQRAFQAATRMVTMLDEMLDHIINRLGVGGR